MQMGYQSSSFRRRRVIPTRTGAPVPRGGSLQLLLVFPDLGRRRQRREARGHQWPTDLFSHAHPADIVGAGTQARDPGLRLELHKPSANVLLRERTRALVGLLARTLAAAGCS
jgi:hypothetical protein